MPNEIDCTDGKRFPKSPLKVDFERVLREFIRVFTNEGGDGYTKGGFRRVISLPDGNGFIKNGTLHQPIPKDEDKQT